MRLFIAINVSKEVEDYLKSVQKQFDETYAKLRLTDPYHLTLKFLGDATEKDNENIIEKLSSIKFKKFRLHMSDIGVFPDSDDIRVIWAGLDEKKGLMDLQKNIEVALEGFNFRKDFDFHPHITLARVSYIKDKQMFKQSIKKINIEKRSFEVTEFILYESSLTPQGPIYKKIKEFCSYN